MLNTFRDVAMERHADLIVPISLRYFSKISLCVVVRLPVKSAIRSKNLSTISEIG